MTEPPPRANFSATANQVCTFMIFLFCMHVRLTY